MQHKTNHTDNQYTIKPPNKILRLPRVKEQTGLPRSTIYLKIANGEFPEPILLGGTGSRNVGWIESEINDWIEQRIQTSRGKKNGGDICNR
ncbi:MAG: hypothetical protein A3F46_06855 [Legionellales bacterium RIFCSPHIGHO2_12_FULL_42_9]|nr:MAG: hypothetical protein A3F46_06855 [Legionellales bacterium RIFCSPHIGHO2_12_FULL_42_9]